ncbi:OadG family protein [Desulforhopalus singaporensis]|uniref:Sodium pump decarboxylases, gamma subunit n=1 Tax=Desulforhopalus singaporensis TaxID=91360 RepID=A0A1H0MKI6_9BACT|nr:OadG family protein [Desulforhopalus singaporensis]SDO80969.1 sodium pump decarboxylases, gamma subunit [Desulforhopalus singaporensis]
MTATELLAQFANPSIVKGLAFSDKMTASVITTILGMGITFAALIILLFIISWTNRILHPKRAVTTSVKKFDQVAPAAPEEPERPETDDLELVAAITASLALVLKVPPSGIVIKNIQRVEHDTPAWNRAGLVEQMNNRL